MNAIRKFLDKRIIKTYSVITGFVLGVGVLTNILGITGQIAIQTIAAFSTIIGILLLFGQILIVMNLVDKKISVGWIIVRLAYVSFFVLCLGLLSIAGGSFISSFYLLGGSSILAGQIFSSVGFTMTASFGICLSAISYHSLSIEKVWSVTNE